MDPPRAVVRDPHFENHWFRASLYFKSSKFSLILSYQNCNVFYAMYLPMTSIASDNRYLVIGLENP
ncbi:hypothetical protein T01_117 [Trichinella spiralis]|uniref:Uncharacterized protein n=1 Tax=Trichinella spiralis TaxID=6334 RepID=A0A0V1BZM9_TRISP|nr:hypothetical protein T01_117 [Trichinella spiralis]